MRCCFIFFILFVTVCISGCRNKTRQDKTPLSAYNELIKTANDDEKPLEERYKAVAKAEAIALQQKKTELQIESLRMTSMLLIHMDSLSKATTICRRLAALASGVQDRESEGVALNNLALIKSEHSEYDSAILFYEQAYRLFFAISDTMRQVQCKMNMAIVYKNIGAFEKAFSNSVDAARIMRAMNANDDVGIAYTTLGNTLKDLRRFEEALSYHQEALMIRKKLADSVGIAGSLNNIGNVYKTNKQFKQALPYFLSALEIKKRNGSIRSRATTYDNIAETMIGLNDYNAASLYARQALELRDQHADKEGWIATAIRLASVYLVQQETGKSLELALRIEQLANNANYRKQQLDNAILLQQIYTRLNKPLDALKYANISSSLKDSLFSGEMAAAISNLQVRYRTEEQRQKFEQADKDNQVKTDQIKRQDLFIILLATTALLLLVVVYLLYASNRLRAKARERTELLMRELSHRVKNNLQIITGILNLQIGEAGNPETAEALTAAKSRIQSIGILHALLYQATYTGAVDIDLFMRTIAQNASLAFSKQADEPDYKIFPSGIQLETDEAVLLGIIINELLTNIYKHAKPQDEVLLIGIKMKQQQQQYKLVITDNGMDWHPLPAGSNNKGLGLRLVYMLAKQIHAKVAFERSANQNNCSITFEKK